MTLEPLSTTSMRKERAAAPGMEPPGANAGYASASVEPIEIVAPDQYCAALLVDHATPLFPAEIVHDSGWIVRLQPPPTGWSWVSALVSLVEDWLESVPLPCVKVLHGGRDYLFRAPSGLAQAAAEQEPASVRAGADMA